MPDPVTLTIDGGTVAVPEGSLVSTAIALAGISSFRRSVTGEPRGPLFGMGICLECRVTSTAAHTVEAATWSTRSRIMPDPVRLTIDGRAVTGEPRAPLCGMGICFECRVTIDGRQHCQSGQMVCAEPHHA